MKKLNAKEWGTLIGEVVLPGIGGFVGNRIGNKIDKKKGRYEECYIDVDGTERFAKVEYVTERKKKNKES